jgi:CubicO group peptidase (beta-lactamase class C family)
MLLGVVHDPTARRMGGVAGHAGRFSTAGDVAIYAQSLLDRLQGRPSKFPVNRLTLEKMTTPQQLASGSSLRGLGWDI